MESQGKILSPQNVSGASKQNSVAAFLKINWSGRGLVLKTTEGKSETQNEYPPGIIQVSKSKRCGSDSDGVLANGLRKAGDFGAKKKTKKGGGQ